MDRRGQAVGMSDGYLRGSVRIPIVGETDSSTDSLTGA